MAKNTPMMEMTRRYGHTVYTINAYGSSDTSNIYEDRLLHLIRHEAEKMDSNKKYNDFWQFAGKMMMADIGNGTMNIMRLVDGRPSEQHCWTEALGVNQCVLTAIVRGYVSGLFDALCVHCYDARLMKLIVMGGSGCLVKNFGKHDPGSIIFVDDLHASAKDYEYMAQGLIWHRERMARKAGE